MLSVDELVGAVVETITELDRLASTFIFFTCEDVANTFCATTFVRLAQSCVL
jgi:hypothetical protein